MSRKELSRLEVLQRLESKRLKQAGAAEQLGLTARQVRRLQTLYRTHGAAGLVSRRRAKEPGAGLAHHALRRLRPDSGA